MYRGLDQGPGNQGSSEVALVPVGKHQLVNISAARPARTKLPFLQPGTKAADRKRSRVKRAVGRKLLDLYERCGSESAAVFAKVPDFSKKKEAELTIKDIMPDFEFAGPVQGVLRMWLMDDRTQKSLQSFLLNHIRGKGALLIPILVSARRCC